MKGKVEEKLAVKHRIIIGKIGDYFLVLNFYKTH